MNNLIVRLPNHLGDACMAVPALDLLAARGCALTLAGRSWAPDLFAAYPWRTAGLPPARPARVAALRRLRHESEGTGALLLTNSFSSALEFRLAGLRPAGYATDGRSWLLSRALAVPRAWADGMHTVEYYHHLASELAGSTSPPPARLALRVAPAALARARAALEAAGLHPPYLMLCPVAVGLHRGRVKAWDGFARLCGELIGRGQRVIACPGPGEREAVQAAAPGATLLPPTDVATFAALLADSRLVVANDSGPGHLAAAVGARLISVFGVTDPDKTRPWGGNVTLVRGAGGGWPAYAEVAAAVSAALAEPRTGPPPSNPSSAPSSSAIM